MKQDKNSLSSRQFAALAFMSLLFPLSRSVPRKLISYAGGGAWLSCLLILPLLIAVYFLIAALCRRDDRGLAQAIKDIWGSFSGGILLLYCAFFTLLSGFLLRNGAERFAATIYPNTKPGIFMLSMLLAALPAACGGLKALGRCAMVLRPILLAVMVLIFAALLPKAKLAGVWQIGRSDISDLFFGAAAGTAPLCIAANIAFLRPHCREKPTLLCFLPWLLTASLSTMLLCLCALGIFGAGLSLQLNNSFFVMIRDISLFGAQARIEALIISTWVFSDFVLISLLLRTASELPAAAFGLGENIRKKLPVLLGALAITAGSLIAPNAIVLQRIEDIYVPAVSAVFELGLPLLTLLLGLARRKI